MAVTNLFSFFLKTPFLDNWAAGIFSALPKEIVRILACAPVMTEFQLPDAIPFFKSGKLKILKNNSINLGSSLFPVKLGGGLRAGGWCRAMTPEQTFGQLLGLGKAWRLVEARFEPECSTFFLLKVEETLELWPEESVRAGTPVVCHDHVEPMQWRHLNVFNKECVIVCALPRGRRGDDSKVYRVTPPWEGRSKHFT
ncbi:MAG: hypothetical protein EXS25_07590 [Pedosphaera sp.]|nr:hypothetical protein [Pedosphaera sp.]